MPDVNTVAVLVDIAIGSLALAKVTLLAVQVKRIMKRLGIVERRTTPPPGTVATVTDISSGPVITRRGE